MEAGKTTKQKVRAGTVNLNCGPWEWECYGSKKVYLFRKGEDFPFITARTDVPVLYLEKNVSISMEGSKGVRYGISPKKNKLSLSTGTVTINPEPHYVAGNATDLLRIEVYL